jgi:hypothetical protein
MIRKETRCGRETQTYLAKVGRTGLTPSMKNSLENLVADAYAGAVGIEVLNLSC